MMWFSPRMVLLWLGRWVTSFGGNVPPKKPKMGVKHNIETHPRFERFRRNLARWCSSTLWTVPTVKNFKFRKSKMAAAAILKNRKITISRPQFKRFRWNLARWHSSTFLTVPIVKNLKFQKSKMAAAAILKNKKSPYVGRDWSDFVEILHSEAVWPSCRVGPLKISNL